MEGEKERKGGKRIKEQGGGEGWERGEEGREGKGDEGKISMSQFSTQYIVQVMMDTYMMSHSKVWCQVYAHWLHLSITVIIK